MTHHGELARILLDQTDALACQIDQLTTQIEELITAMPEAAAPEPGDPRSPDRCSRRCRRRSDRAVTL